MYEIKQNSAKIWTYSSSRSSKVINFDASRKRICNFLLVINSNYERNLYRFRDIDAFRSKIAWFSHPILVWRPSPQRRNALRYQRNLYVAKSTFNGLQFCRKHYRSIFIRLAALLPPKIAMSREIPTKFDSSSRSSKVIDLGVNRKLTCEFLRLIVTLAVSATVFEMFTFKARK